ncbi:diacylglycerol kinase eta isoform X2 [Athalia rosae]|uniref:diacylglycerol kinase eta isoform X2 n=1 Tax=Athalia rosae TaxID=37344 RepID=UPI002034675B|nr:diacylglycerol kinase eta isoform X2 [Athalia rosae]
MNSTLRICDVDRPAGEHCKRKIVIKKTSANVCNNDNDNCNNDSETKSSVQEESASIFYHKLRSNDDHCRTIFENSPTSDCVKEGFLLKQTSKSFQRWQKRYFKLQGSVLYYSKNCTEAAIFDEIELTEDLTFAECSIKNVNHSFQVITPFRSLILCGESRRDMEEWLSALRAAGEGRSQGEPGPAELLGGNHHWYATSHARPTYCNVCRDALYGVTSHGLSCEVCKCKVHKRCAAKAINNCKWTTLASIGKDIIEDEDGNITMPHQWMEGNLPVSSKCLICDKTCGSVLRLQDWRCLWCRATVHTACRPAIYVRCPLGPAKVSVVPPTALHSIGSDEAWEAVRPTGSSPLLVFVNSKSGDNQGVKFLRRFKQLLNPAQVFDLINGGPGLGLRLFRHFDPFRILVCSGDGSVGWVLSEIDRLGMHKQCQVGVLPLGTGNDLARVLGWGASCDDDAHLPQLLEKYEKASTKMLDRWSIMTFERSISFPSPKMSLSRTDSALNTVIAHQYEDSVVTHITNILQSDQDNVVISSAKVLCETVKDFTVRISEASQNTGDQQLGEKCEVLRQKLDLLLETLHKEESFISDGAVEADSPSPASQAPLPVDGEEKGALEKPEKDINNLKRVRKKRNLVEREAIVSRANSLKRAIRCLVEHTELAVDEQNSSPSDRQASGAPNITVTCDDGTVETSKYEKRNHLDIPGLRSNNVEHLHVLSAVGSVGSAEMSPCPSPTPNLVSLSPMPDLRRDSQAEEMLALPAPDGFADSRRNSSNLPKGVFSFEVPTVEATIHKLFQQHQQHQGGILEHNDAEFNENQQAETPSDIQVTVTSTTLDTSSPSDDTTIQDTMISPDTDSANSRNISPDNDQKLDNYRKRDATYGSRSSCSCSNSIVSSDSMIMDTLDSKNFTIKNSESEIGHIDSDILDTLRHSDSPEMGHIDSPENSDTCHSEAQNSESIIDDLSSLGQDLISAMLGERYDSVRDCLKSEQPEKPRKFCSLAQFVEGNDIARRSFKKPAWIPKKKDSEKISSAADLGGEPARKNDSANRQPNNSYALGITCEEKSSEILGPVCCFAVNSDKASADEQPPTTNPPVISVIVDPPSPSMSIEKRDLEPEAGYKLDSRYNRRYSGGSMEKLSVELPGLGFSPQATRRISSGSLLKASEVVSLAAQAARFGGSSLSVRHERTKSVDKTEDAKKLPIINPLVQLPMWPNVSRGAGLISQALLANADALCAAVSPLMDPDETLLEGYYERCVMNNYFGIGIDAKISLDFHHKREEHPEKCRSRAKNYMWYGVLGSKQWLQKTYKNLEQRVQLECDGQRIPLPSLQGIVVLNIPSFMGGTNFWGGTKEGDLFLAPSFDDRILEVVAVFGSVQMAASRLINLQHHRIAQCQTVQINILGDEGVPIQVDGEAWIQPPGMIRIIHKNRMQMLYRNRALETSLRTWEEKQRSSTSTSTSMSSQSTSTMCGATQTQSPIDAKPSNLNEDEMSVLFSFIEAVTTLVKWVKLLIISHPSLEPELYQVAARTAVSLENVHPGGKIIQGPGLRPVVTELVSSARQLYEDSCELLRDKAHNLRLREDLESKLSTSLASMEQELRKCVFDESGTGLVYLHNLQPDEQGDKKNRHRGLFWLKFRRTGWGSGNHPGRDQVTSWGVTEVCSWLDSLQLSEYAENFMSHDIRGKELLTLARRDLKELGITKVGHVKRILQAINDLNN